MLADFVVDDDGGRVNDVEGRVIIPVDGLLSSLERLITILGDFFPRAGAETARLSL